MKLIGFELLTAEDFETALNLSIQEGSCIPAYESHTFYEEPLLQNRPDLQKIRKSFTTINNEDDQASWLLLDDEIINAINLLRMSKILGLEDSLFYCYECSYVGSEPTTCSNHIVYGFTS